MITFSPPKESKLEPLQRPLQTADVIVCVCFAWFGVCVCARHSPTLCCVLQTHRTSWWLSTALNTTQPGTKPNSYPDVHYLLHLNQQAHTGPETTSFFNCVCVLRCNCIKLQFDCSCLVKKNEGLALSGPSSLGADWPAGRHRLVISCLMFNTGFHKLITESPYLQEVLPENSKINTQNVHNAVC